MSTPIVPSPHLSAAVSIEAFSSVNCPTSSRCSAEEMSSSNIALSLSGAAKAKFGANAEAVPPLGRERAVIPKFPVLLQTPGKAEPGPLSPPRLVIASCVDKDVKMKQIANEALRLSKETLLLHRIHSSATSFLGMLLVVLRCLRSKLCISRVVLFPNRQIEPDAGTGTQGRA
jgi:hypothetical protein